MPAYKFLGIVTETNGKSKRGNCLICGTETMIAFNDKLFAGIPVGSFIKPKEHYTYPDTFDIMN
jgi:hypothetical protein